ncbi:MAG: helix-turn-helix transcriptional regulator [Rhodanobacteraceae bacterium]|jgi:AraC family transcriptional regulator|nr:helix-turn-helix transcriptional regulator [Rhodanobacteraceae bacterium]
MLLVSHRLAHGASLDLSERQLQAGGEPAIAVVSGGGRGCVLRVDAPVGGLWIPLRGRVQLGPGADTLAYSGEAWITEADGRVQAIGRGNAAWVALLGTRAGWRRAIGDLIEMPSLEPLLVPARHLADRDLRRSAIALARAAATGSADSAAHAVIDRILALQAGFAEAIARCPGRTYAQRRQVFVRLQRVRLHLASNCHLDIDNDALAAMASYSPWHFIRAFRSAYGETPHAYLVRLRLERARRLLRVSPLSVAEIALASGFENRCAFSRLFRQRFGVTAGAMRRAGPARVVLANAQLRQLG